MNFGYVFLTAFVFFMVSFVFLALTREVPDHTLPDDESIWNYIKNMKNVFLDRHFRNFLIDRIITSFMFASSGFITVYLLEKFSLPDETAAVFTAIVLVSQGLSSFLFGPLGDRKGHKLNLILSKIFYSAAVILAFLSTSPVHAYPVFALMGLVNTTNNVGNMAITLDFVSGKRKELYMGSLYFSIAPFSFVAPLIGGKIADLSGYGVLMVLTGLIGVFGIFYVVKFIVDPRVSNKNN